MNIFRRIKKAMEPKDCEHGYHNYSKKIYEDFGFPTGEKLWQCEKCGIQRYQYFDSYMGGILLEVVDYDINIDEVRFKHGIDEDKKMIEKEYETQEGRDKRYNKRMLGEE